MSSTPYAVLAPLPQKASSHTGESTRFFPRPGRAAPARLHVVPSAPPADESTVYARDSGRLTWKDILALRGELPAPRPAKSKPGPIAPWNKKGFVYPEPDDKAGNNARAHASSQEGLARIRSVPKNLAALLKTVEWKGARVVGTLPSPEIAHAERALADSEARVAESEREIHGFQEQLLAPDMDERVRSTLGVRLSSARASLAQRQISMGDCRKRLETARAEEWLHVVHPSGAELRIRPQWGNQ